MGARLRRSAGAALVVAALIGVSACTSQSPVTTSGSGYVAMGDSFTSATNLTPRDDSPGCFRSQVNYPHLLATRFPSLDLRDVSCGGATSTNMFESRTVGDLTVPAQMDALSASTKLVTIGIGGNDGNLFTSLILGCARAARSDSTGSPCKDAGSTAADAAIPAIRAHVDTLLDSVDSSAPSARVVLVGYPRLLPDDGTTCRKLAPFAPGDYAFIDQVGQDVSDALEASAKAHSADFVDVFAASAGHDLCSAKPWVNGPKPAPDGATPYHSLAVGQRAIARLVARTIGLT